VFFLCLCIACVFDCVLCGELCVFVCVLCVFCFIYLSECPITNE